MRLIEKKNDTIGVTVHNGALMNYIAAGGQNGSLNGFNLSISNGNLVASKGTLIIQGFTFETDGETLLDLTAQGIDSTDPRIVCIKLDYSAEDKDSAYSLVVKKASEEGGLSKDEIQNGITGSYYYTLCSFVKNGSSFSDFVSKVSGIALGGAGGSGVASVPQPQLTVMKSKSLAAGVPSIATGYLCLGNYDEFLKLANQYTIRLEFYRNVKNAKYRSGYKLWTKKTQLIYSGKLSDVLFSDLTIPNDISAGSQPYKAKIMNIRTMIDYFFYDDSTNLPIVDGTTQAHNVRCTRSKIRKARGNHQKHFKYNYLEFGYKVKLYNSNKQLVGESPCSNLIRIAVNNTKPNATGGYFIITSKA